MTDKQILDPDEPAERLYQRCIEGVSFAIESLQRLRQTLPDWIRPDGRIDHFRAAAALGAIQCALATMSPVNLERLAERTRKGELGQLHQRRRRAA